VTLGSEVLCDGAISREEALGLAWQFEPLHAPLALTGGLVRILRAVIQVPVLAVFHAGQELAPGRLVALEFISDEHPRDILQPLEEFSVAYTLVLTRYSWWCARSAQTIRAFLLAKATAARFLPHRAMSALSH